MTYKYIFIPNKKQKQKQNKKYQNKTKQNKAKQTNKQTIKQTNKQTNKILSYCLLANVQCNINLFSDLTVTRNELFTRIEFTLFLAGVVATFLYILPPRVSKRDMDNLSYVGLDKIVRKLLHIKKR